MRYCFFLPILLVILAPFNMALAQQIPDTAFTYRISAPEYPEGKGPLVVLDEAHDNFHTLGGRYYAFGKLLRRDGYRVKPATETFTRSRLQKIDILVIANALPEEMDDSLPTPSAFSEDEIMAVKEWVAGGGSLFLIADHMPFAGAADALAAAFGFNSVNGYALPMDNRIEIFSREQGNLMEHAITNGRNTAERIDSIQLFTGQGFLCPPGAEVLTRLQDDYVILLPLVTGELLPTTPYIRGTYFVNGASLSYGKGRVVYFGEAAMFSAQLAGEEKLPMGMNAPRAIQNPQLLLNIIHWLDHKY